MAVSKRKSDRLFSRSTSVTSPSSLHHVSFGSDLDVVLDDQNIKSDPLENKNRRTIVVRRENGSFGFTLQSYGLRGMNSDETDLLSYVDYVEFGGPAYKAGMREGDVILSINGKCMENVDHEKLVECIKHCEDSIRMVVLFEDVCRKIELHLRYFKLKQILETKKDELRSLAEQETKILQNVGSFGSNNISLSELIETSSVFGSTFFNYGDNEPKLSERNMSSSSSVFQLTGDLCQAVHTPWMASLNSCSSIVDSPTQSMESPQAQLSHDNLPSYDDAFWSANSGYGSLPIRSQKRSIKGGSAARRTGSVRWNIGDRPLVNSTLHEEGDESNDHLVHTNLSIPNPLTPAGEFAPAIHLLPQKLKDKKSTSVPNIIKLKIQKSPFLPRRLPSMQVDSNQKLMRNDQIGLQGSIAHDPRTMTKQLRQEISNYVITEDLDRRPDDPQLLGLRQLCNDFRYGCIQESLKQRRKSIELKMTFDPNSKQFYQKKTGFQLSKAFGSFKTKRNKKLTGLESCDLGRQFSRGETESTTMRSKLANLDEKNLDNQAFSDQGKELTGLRQNLPNSVSDSGQEDMELEVVDGCSKSMPGKKLTQKEMASLTENSTELSTVGCDIDQCVNKRDEVTWL